MDLFPLVCVYVLWWHQPLLVQFPPTLDQTGRNAARSHEDGVWPGTIWNLLPFKLLFVPVFDSFMFFGLSAMEVLFAQTHLFLGSSQSAPGRASESQGLSLEYTQGMLAGEVRFVGKLLRVAPSPDHQLQVCSFTGSALFPPILTPSTKCYSPQWACSFGIFSCPTWRIAEESRQQLISNTRVCDKQPMIINVTRYPWL